MTMPTDAVLLPAQVTIALMATNPFKKGGRAWQLRSQIVAYVGLFPEGIEVSRDTVAYLLGRGSQGNTGAVLHRLVDDRVLLVVAPASGRRPTAYRVNPMVTEWRGVPWTRSARDVWLSMFHEAHLPADDQGRSRPLHVVADNGGVAGHRMHRPTRGAVVGQYMDRPTTGADAGHYMDRPTTIGAVGHRMGWPTTAGGAPSSTPADGVGEFSADAVGGDQQAGELRVEGLELVAGAIRRRCGAQFVATKFHPAIATLIATHGQGTVLDAVAAEAPQPARFIGSFISCVGERLAAVAAGLDPDAADDPPEPPAGPQSRPGPATPPVWTPEEPAAPPASREAAQAAARRAREAAEAARRGHDPAAAWG